MSNGLRGLKAIVTGATRGIGLAILEKLNAQGVDVAFCARNATCVTRVAAKFNGATRAIGQALDVSDREAVQRWVEQSADELGGLDIVISSASAMANGLEEEDWLRAFNTDLMGCQTLVEAAFPHLKESCCASIVAIGSVQDREITATPNAYGPIKAALVHYMSGVALRGAKKGIRANVVSPGNIYFKGSIWDRFEKEQPELYRTALARNPTGRMGTAAEVANVVAFLAGRDATFVSGTNLLVDGALTRAVQY